MIGPRLPLLPYNAASFICASRGEALLKNENPSRPRSGPSENSPAIYRWGSATKSKQSAKRTDENQTEIREKPSISTVRYTDYLINLDLLPALKCWAIFISSAPRTIPIYAFWATLGGEANGQDEPRIYADNADQKGTAMGLPQIRRHSRNLIRNFGSRLKLKL